MLRYCAGAKKPHPRFTPAGCTVPAAIGQLRLRPRLHASRRLCAAKTTNSGQSSTREAYIIGVSPAAVSVIVRCALALTRTALVRICAYTVLVPARSLCLG